MPRVKLDQLTPDPQLLPKQSEEVVLQPEIPDDHPEFLAEEKSDKEKEVFAKSDTDQEIMKSSGKTGITSFMAYPKKVHFSGQLQDEEVVLLIRAHPITNVPWLLVVFLLSFVPVVGLPLGSLLNLATGYGNYVVLFSVAWYAALYSYSLLKFVAWFFNAGIVTDERIVDIDWNSLTDIEVTTTEMNDVQDASEKSVGVLASVFDFGNVFVQTAGEHQNIDFLFIPHPRLVVKKIEELMQKEETEHETHP